MGAVGVLLKNNSAKSNIMLMKFIA